MSGMSDEERLAFLEARVEALEARLEQRSHELRTIQRHLDGFGLLVVSRVLAGLPPLPRRAHDLELWQETTELTSADVEETMTDLWRSLAPPEAP